MKTFLVALISAVVTSICWAIGLVVVYLYLYGSAPPFQVQVDAPSRVLLGEVTEVTIQVTNPTEKKMVIDSVDIYSSLLDGFEVLEINPSPASDSQIFNFRSLSFSRPVEPGETLAIVVPLKAKETGYWAGDIDVCTPAQRFTTVSAGIVVEEGS